MGPVCAGACGPRRRAYHSADQDGDFDLQLRCVFLTMDPLNAFANKNLATATDEELASLKAMTDDDLLRATQTLDLFAVVEASRRLREATQKEETATKRLTVILVALTIVLVILTLILVFFGYETLRP